MNATNSEQIPAPGADRNNGRSTLSQGESAIATPLEGSLALSSAAHQPNLSLETLTRVLDLPTPAAVEQSVEQAIVTDTVKAIDYWAKVLAQKSTSKEILVSQGLCVDVSKELQSRYAQVGNRFSTTELFLLREQEVLESILANSHWEAELVVQGRSAQIRFSTSGTRASDETPVRALVSADARGAEILRLAGNAKRYMAIRRVEDGAVLTEKGRLVAKSANNTREQLGLSQLSDEDTVKVHIHLEQCCDRAIANLPKLIEQAIADGDRKISIDIRFDDWGERGAEKYVLSPSAFWNPENWRRLIQKFDSSGFFIKVLDNIRDYSKLPSIKQLAEAVNAHGMELYVYNSIIPTFQGYGVLRLAIAGPMDESERRAFLSSGNWRLSEPDRN